MRRKYTPLFTLLLVGLLFSLNAQAEPVARVLFAHGEVQAQRADESLRALNRGDHLYAGDTVQTGKASSVQFRFSDGALIALRAESDYHIEQHRYDSQHPEENAQSGELLRGGLRAITGAIARERPEAVKTLTPVATIGIRGTVYETFYIPPEGHPALADVAPGHYAMVLRGRVAMYNEAGELVFGDGEIAYTPDANTAPTLRPDLAELFGRFAALDGGEQIPGPQQFAEEVYQQGTDDTLSPYRHLAELSIGDEHFPEPSSHGPSEGPFAFMLSDQGGVAFLSQAVEMGGQALVSAQGGEGPFSSFSAGTTEPLDTGEHTVGDSTIYWGWYPSWDEPADLDSDWIGYVSATNVILDTNALPTTGSATYNLIPGFSVTETTASLEVDFAAAQMQASLSLEEYEGAWETRDAQPIANFYSDNGLSLSNDAYGTNGTLIGRFVGSEADGAIGWYSIVAVDDQGELTVYGMVGLERQ